MSLLFLVSVAVLFAAIVLIEFRAIRAGDERRHHAPGYALVLGGLILIGVGIAAAVSELVATSLLASSAGLIVVALGATRHTEVPAH